MTGTSGGSGYTGGWYASGITAETVMGTCHRCIWTYSCREKVWYLKAIDAGCKTHGHGSGDWAAGTAAEFTWIKKD